MVALKCRCADTAHHLNIKCPNVANHRRLESYPYFRSTLMVAVEEYHKHVLDSGLLGKPVVVEPFEPIGVTSPDSPGYYAQDWRSAPKPPKPPKHIKWKLTKRG